MDGPEFRDRTPRHSRSRTTWRIVRGLATAALIAVAAFLAAGILSPLATLERGYAVLQGADGHVLTSVAGLEPKTAISVRVADGRVHATTTRTEILEESDG